MQILYTKTFSYLDNFKPSHLGIYFSLLLHLSIILFAVGLPDLFKPKQVYVPQIIPIEILNVTDVTSITPLKESLEVNEKQTKKIKQKKFNSSDNTEFQKIDLQEKPKKNTKNYNNISEDIPLIQKSDTKEINLNEKKVNTNNKQINKIEKVETLKEKKIKPKLKPKPKLKDKIESKSDIVINNKTKPILNIDKKNKIIDKPKPVEKPKPDLTMASIMKDLRNEEKNNIQEELVEKKEDKISEGQKEELVDNSELQITLANLAMQQLQGCVSIDSGQLKGNYSSQYIKTKAKYNIDGKVIENSIQIVDINISNKIKKMIESRVVFALNTCSLSLPDEHYELWKSITMTFDVEKMLNK
jgi:hypothetical protein